MVTYAWETYLDVLCTLDHIVNHDNVQRLYAMLYMFGQGTSLSVAAWHHAQCAHPRSWCFSYSWNAVVFCNATVGAALALQSTNLLWYCAFGTR